MTVGQAPVGYSSHSGGGGNLELNQVLWRREREGGSSVKMAYSVFLLENGKPDVCSKLKALPICLGIGMLL